MRAAVALLACGAAACGDNLGVDEPLDDNPAWARHTITRAGVKGADGVALGDLDGDGRSDVVAPWEEGGGVTVSLHPGALGDDPWPTVRLSAWVTGYEDAMFADVDGDGRLDVVGACECNRVTIWFAPHDAAQLLDPDAWQTLEIAAAAPAPHDYMQLAFADLDGDGRRDIVAGSRTARAEIAYFAAPPDARDAAGWVNSYRFVGDAGWVMSLLPRDVDGDGDLDLVVSDRAPIGEEWSLFGSRWLENGGAGAAWIDRPITGAAHDGSPKFIAVTDFDGDGIADVLEGRGDRDQGFPNSIRVVQNSAADWSGAWRITELGDASDVGDYQSIAAGDLDRDGRLDLVLGYSYTEPAESGIIWMRDTGRGWEREDISGRRGVKWDNIALADVDGDGDLDVVQSEQGVAGQTKPVDQLGVVWFENPGPVTPLPGLVHP